MNAARRMALQYILLFAGTGVSLPFAGLWLGERGLTGTQIGVLLAAPMLARVIIGPASAIWADGFRYRRTPIAWLGLIAALGYGGAGLAQSPWLIGVCWFVGASAVACLIPLIDVLAIRLARREGFVFALPRGCGSAAFVAANLIMGAWLTDAPAGVVVIWLVVVSSALGLAAWLTGPNEPVRPEGEAAPLDRFAGLGGLLRNPAFLLAISAVGCIQAAHAAYYAFSALIWKGQGLSEGVTGVLWAFAVVVEIGFMWVIEPWRRRAGIGPWAMLALGGAAAIVRWIVMAATPGLAWLWPLQTLHAFSFAATYLAGVELVERLSPASSLTAAQTLSSVLSAGILIGLATAAAGPLYAQFGAGAYLAMAGLAGCGLALVGFGRRMDMSVRHQATA